jgi:alcohol dehydrogenase
MGRKAKAAVFEDIGKVTIKEFDLPRIGPADGLLKVEMVGICGSDVSAYHGKAKRDFPFIPGHESVLRIEEIGEEAAKRYNVAKGDRVIVESTVRCGNCFYCLTGNYRFCPNRFAYGFTSCSYPPHLWGAYGEYMYLAPSSIVYKISDRVSNEAGMLIFACLANGIQWVGRLAQTSIGDTIVIQGVGPQGLAATIAAKEAGASPIIVTGMGVDEQAKRFGLAQEFGADYTINVEENDVIEQVKEITGGKMADVVVDVTGSPRAIVKSIDLVRAQGTVLCAGLAGSATEVPIITNKIVTKEIRFQGALSKGTEAVLAAIRLAETQKFPLEKMVTHIFPLSEVEQALRVAGSEVAGAHPIRVALTP